jgi:plasmid maintenance system killer protein
VLKKYVSVITILDAAKELRDLWNRPSLNFEKLEGTKGGKERYSARLDRKYRVEMTIEWEGKEKIRIEIIHIEELSKHYGD